ncbi:MAG: hypothetical protein ACI9DG_001153 [Oleispira sp.]|jgi:hypothetical protein
MTNETSYFDVHKQFPNGTSMILGFLAISHTKTGKIIEQQFMYEAEYTSHPLAVEIRPLMTTFVIPLFYLVIKVGS